MFFFRFCLYVSCDFVQIGKDHHRKTEVLQEFAHQAVTNQISRYKCWLLSFCFSLEQHRVMVINVELTEHSLQMNQMYRFESKAFLISNQNKLRFPPIPMRDTFTWNKQHHTPSTHSSNDSEDNMMMIGEPPCIRDTLSTWRWPVADWERGRGGYRGFRPGPFYPLCVHRFVLLFGCILILNLGLLSGSLGACLIFVIFMRKRIH